MPAKQHNKFNQLRVIGIPFCLLFMRHIFKTLVFNRCNSGYVSDPRCGVKDLTPVFTTQVHRTKVRETVPSDFTSTRIIMYALSITLFICLISIGGYVAIQRGLLTCLLSPFDAKNMTDNSPLSASYSRRSNFLGGNLGFSKLEEEVEESNGNVQA